MIDISHNLVQNKLINSNLTPKIYVSQMELGIGGKAHYNLVSSLGFHKVHIIK